ncbi:hypothetical protein KM1_077490 [Entamoeba histolytica HM-3:IMSS]|uniref:Chromo domain-containing protein n=3 Tax=Entamoeba histolytica TaxID=5759 RepID=C4LXF7_ENTH1|nr:hypothetical protein EHI_130890 [Entamoeba histolytica HM-1:IMSS]EAL50160.1 hypothetical protein EHI_130890 [Entamoeba histolytica HM-1:IMSS]EMS11344.1 hypothetical protein KM1_077490 [Entamoeba histolytica HM-3:IMSS]GAT93436.1 hypothetical protein CL6EHI_130890 [Entamoeba histolytica]|eukprot:XP_655546.1 hypothetical protein EHI_130890 [Entamoeba histolytica HM-1:IMSS]
MVDSSSDTFEVNDILTFIDQSHIFEYADVFKYFIPSKLVYEEIPSNTLLFLVMWKNFSILRSTWVSREEIEGNSRLDPDNVFKKFIDQNTIDGILYQPRLTKIIPARDLVPEKILSSCYDETATEMFTVKWKYCGNVFISTEEPSFFNNPRYKMLIPQYRNKVEKIKPLSSLSKVPTLNIETINPEYKEEVEICNNVFEKLHKNHGCWIKKIGETDGELFVTHKLKITILQYMKLLMDNDIKGPHLIVTDESGIDFYKENIEKFIPNAYVTFINKIPKEEDMKEVLDNELYHTETDCLKCSFVVTTTLAFQFRVNVEFDIAIVDTEPTLFFNSKYYIKEHTFLLLYNGAFDEAIIKNHCRRRKIKELQIFEYNMFSYFIRYVDVYLNIHQIQKPIYNDLITIAKSCNNEQTGVILNEIKKLLIYPKMFDTNLKTQGTKVDFILKCIKIIGSIPGIKLAVLGDYDMPLRYISKITRSNYIDWNIDIKKTKAICEIMKCSSEKNAEKVKDLFEKELNNDNTRKSPITLSGNSRVVCVHNSCISTEIDLSCIDIVIDMSNDYTPLFETNIRNKYMMATVKQIIAFDMSIKNTIDEITSSMNELDETLTLSQELQVYRNLIKYNSYRFGYKGKAKSIKFGKLGQEILKYGTEYEQLQLVIEVMKDDIEIISNFEKNGFISINDINKEINIQNQQLSKLQNLPKTLKLPVTIEHSSKKTPSLKFSPPTIFNKERLSQKYPEQFNSENKLVKPISLDKSINDTKQNSLKQQPEIPIGKLEVINDLSDSNTMEEEEPIINPNLINIIKEHSQLIQQDKAIQWIKSLTSAIKRYGRDLRLWKIDFTQFIPLTKVQLQYIVDKLLTTLPPIDPQLTKMANIMETFTKANNFVAKKKALLPYPECSLKFWDCSCDIELLQLIIENGLNVPELYLNDIIIRSVLEISGLITEKQKCEFLKIRIDKLYKCYSICQFN